MPKSKKSETKMPETENEIRDEFNKLSENWKQALKPSDYEKVIELPESKIPWDDRPRWPRVTKPRLKIPIGPLASMFAMYHWYLFLGRHLLREEILELTNSIFVGIRINSEAFLEHITNPKVSFRKAFGSLDDENRHQLVLRCDRWFKNYLSENPPASKRARYLVGFRGRVGHLKVKLPSIGGRELESWKACIHYGVLNSSTDRKNRLLERSTAEKVLLYHYNDGPDGDHTLKRSINNVSSMLDDNNNKITVELFRLYESYKLLWINKAQDMVHEYEYETDGKEPRKINGRSLEVPDELRRPLGLKHSHITLDSAKSAWLSEIFEQYPDPERVQSSSQGQRTDSRSHQEYLPHLPPIDYEDPRPFRPDPETVPGVAGSSMQASTVGSYPLSYSDAQSRSRQEIPYGSSSQIVRTGYGEQYPRPSPGDPMSAATTSMGNLSVAASALDSSQDRATYEDDIFTRTPQDRPNYEYEIFASTLKPVREEARIPQDRPYYKHNIFASTPEPAEQEPSEEKIVKKKRKKRTEDKETEERPEEHDRSETPPDETRPGKRQSGKKARDNLDQIYSQRET